MKKINISPKLSLLPLLFVLLCSSFLSLIGTADEVQAADCTFTRNEDRTQITKRCGSESAVLKYQNGGKSYSRTYASTAGGGFTQCTEQVKLDTNTAGTHKILFGNSTNGAGLRCGGVSLGTVNILNSGGVGTDSVRTALNDIINKNCNTQANNTLRNECVSTWENAINQCAATQNNNPGSEAYKASMAKCIAGKKSYSEAAIKNAIKNVDKEIENRKEIEKCDKAGKDYDTESRECVERCSDGQILGDDGKCVDSTSCAIDGIGWIVCPVMSFIGMINDAALGFISGKFLNIDPDLVGKDTESAWSSFRDIANVLFVIAFLIIVYSQITGQGVSNYGLKKLIPRLVAVAILVNLSFILCKLAIDVSNVVGAGMSSLIGDALPATISTDGDNYTGIKDLSWEKAIGAGLAGGGAAIVGIAVLVAIGLPALLVLAMILLLLIARKAIVILLVVVAPIAFAAYLLPNTQNLFGKWWSLFKAMLIVYPVIGLVFGASQLAAIIINNSGKDDLLVQLTALAVLSLPLFTVPILLKGAMSATGQLGTRLNNLSDRATKRATGNIKQGRTGEALESYGRYRRNKRFARRRGEGKLAQFGEKHSDTRVGKVASWAGTRQRAFDESSIGQKVGGTRGAALATQGIHKQFDEDVSAFKATMSSKSNEELVAMVGNTGLSSEQRAAAAGMVMSRSHRESHLQALSSVRSQMEKAEKENDTKSMSALSNVQMQMTHDMKDKPFGLGDQSMGQLVDGSYGKTHIDDRGNSSRAKDVFEELRTRAGTKLSAQSLATMNPDEMNHIYKDALEENLSPSQIKNVVDKINEARNNQQMDALIKPEARTQHDEIIAKAAEMGITASATSGQNTTTNPGIILPGDSDFRGPGSR